MRKKVLNKIQPGILVKDSDSLSGRSFGRRRYFSPRECVKFLAKRKTVPPEAITTEPHEISNPNTSL